MSHRWDKLDTHRYRCRLCGMEKLNLSQSQDGRRYPDWVTVFRDANGQETRGATPPCHGDLPAIPAPAQPPARSLGQWSAYVESGATLQERRARLAEVPEPLRDSVKDHLVTVFALRDAARMQGKERGRRAAT